MDSSVPTGTVTLLFSDIEGSTRMLIRLGTGAYGEVLAVQRRLQRRAYQDWNGREMGTEGDSFFVAFSSAREAVNACIQAQRALEEHEWPDGGRIRVRMGLHTGEPEVYENGYVGLDVHLAARVAATAYGGQVVVSDATARLLAGRLPHKASLRSLGAHRLKDIVEAQHLHQVVAPGLEANFPRPRSLGTTTNLPTPAQPLVGRERECSQLTEMVRRDDVRLHTVTGPGGAGKTRLVVPVAEAVADNHPDGVYFVPLETVTEITVMWTTIAEVLGLTGESKAPPAFFDHLADRRLLLVLDNLEQLPAAGAEVVAKLLDAVPGMFILATSRRPLHLPGEQEYALETLELPPADASVEEAEQAGAVALFVLLARRVRPGFTLTTHNVADVTALCRRLDGLPLALELAAARSKLLSPRALLGLLDRGLETSRAGRPDRQRTLRATVAWSYDLLPPALQTALRALGVFAEGADLDAVGAVLGVGDPLETVTQLVDASLVRVEDRPGGVLRVRLLETVRRFALEELGENGELDDLRRRHAEHYLAVAETAAESLRGPRVLDSRDVIEGELGNLRQALTWALQADASVDRNDRVSIGLRLCMALGWFWYTSGYVTEGRSWAQRASSLAYDQQGPELASVLHTLAILLLQQGEHRHGRDILAKCLRMWRRIGDRSKIALELNSLGVAYRNLGDDRRARDLLEESAHTARELPDSGPRLATALTNLGVLEMDAGNAERALEIFSEAETVDRQQGDEWGVLATQANQAGALVLAGRAVEAEALLRSISHATLALGDIDLTVNAIELFAMCCAGISDPHRAARLSGAARTLRQQAGVPLAEPDLEFFERGLAPARKMISEQAWTTEEQAGRLFSAVEAIQHARDR